MTPRNLASPRAKFGRFRWNSTSVIKEIQLKIWLFASRLTRSSEPTRLVRHRTSYCSSTAAMGLCCTASEIIGDFNRKSQLFPPPLYLSTPLKVFPLEFGTGAWNQKKNRIMWLPGWEVWRYLQPSGYNTRTWRTDRHRSPDDSKDSAYA